jgi:hypothetical protein
VDYFIQINIQKELIKGNYIAVISSFNEEYYLSSDNLEILLDKVKEKILNQIS